MKQFNSIIYQNIFNSKMPHYITYLLYKMAKELEYLKQYLDYTVDIVYYKIKKKLKCLINKQYKKEYIKIIQKMDDFIVVLKNSLNNGC
jgi:hypothetical protein